MSGNNSHKRSFIQTYKTIRQTNLCKRDSAWQTYHEQSKINAKKQIFGSNVIYKKVVDARLACEFYLKGHCEKLKSTSLQDTKQFYTIDSKYVEIYSLRSQ